MNNILPSDIPIHEKYDLKGSLYKRKASKAELAKAKPTYKDLDFLEEHKDGLILDEKNYDNIISSLRRDCLILQSFGIMDYSLLLGIHNLEKEKVNSAIEAYYDARIGDPIQTNSTPSTSAASNYDASRANKKWENIFTISAVPARSGKGERLLLYFGIIDILQSYRLRKKLEHTFKSMITDGVSLQPISHLFNRLRIKLNESVFV